MKHGRDLAARGSPSGGILLGILACAAAAWIRLGRPEVQESTRPFIDLADDLAVLLAASGALILGYALIQMPRRSGTDAARTLTRVAPAALMALASALFIDRVVATKTAILGGVRTFWLDDDMMISMRYAKNLAEGAGLVWNRGGPHVEGYTNFLWTLIMAIPHALGLPSVKASAGVLAFEWLGLLVVLGLAWVIGRRMGLPPVLRWVAALLIAGNRWLLYWTVAGSEVALLALLMLAAAASLQAARRRRPAGWGAGFGLGLLGLVRADSLAPEAVFLAIWIWLSRRGRTRPWAWLPALVLPGAQILWRRAYYGQWLPNTYYLRMVDVPTRETFGVFYGISFGVLFVAVLVLVVLALAASRHPLTRWLALVPLTALGYAVYAGGDELPEYRFLAPAAPLAILTAAGAAWEILRSTRSARTFSRPLRLGLAVLTLALASFQSLALPHALRKLGVERGEHESKNVRIGLMLKAHTRPEAVIAHFWAGAAPYFSERPALDMLGKCDTHIARLKASSGDFQPGHNKYDGAYIFDQKPDAVVAATGADVLQDRSAWEGSATRKDYPGLFLPLDNPVFWNDYSKSAAESPLSKGYHGVFLRRGDSLADPPAAWRDIPIGSRSERR